MTAKMLLLYLSMHIILYIYCIIHILYHIGKTSCIYLSIYNHIIYMYHIMHTHPKRPIFQINGQISVK